MRTKRNWLIDSGPVAAPPEVSEGLEAVRRSGEVNLLNHEVAQAVAKRMGYIGVARWIEEHPYPYIVGLVRGFAKDALE